LYQTGRLNPRMRAFVVTEADRIGVSRAARNIGVSRTTVYRWRRRAGDVADRSCRPHRSPRRTSAEREAALLAARLEWRWGPDRIGPMTGVAQRTAYRILRRFNMHRLRELFPEERPQRGVFRATDPGEVVQIDIKNASGLARGGGRRHAFATRIERRTKIGWQYVHVAIDAASRRSYLEFLPGVKTEDCVGFLQRAIADFDAHGIRVRRVLTDNGNGYKRRFGEACADLGIAWTRTKPYHPWTNGRVERFNRTLKGECLYAGLQFTSDEERRYHAALWRAFYNADRPHRALDGLSPECWLRARGVTGV
jgi:transposase InsO family protein